jgi:hypothetical protein
MKFIEVHSATMTLKPSEGSIVHVGAGGKYKTVRADGDWHLLRLVHLTWWQRLKLAFDGACWVTVCHTERNKLVATRSDTVT